MFAPIPKFKATALDLSGMAEQFDAAPEKIRMAARRALAFAARWANSEALKQVPKVTGIRANIIAGRIRMEIMEESGRVWIGLNPIDVKKLHPVQTADGISADGFEFPGAFMPWGIEGPVFRRIGKERLPIKKLEVAISQKATVAIQQIAMQIRDKFNQEFKRQLSWLTA